MEAQLRPRHSLGGSRQCELRAGGDRFVSSVTGFIHTSCWVILCTRMLSVLYSVSRFPSTRQTRHGIDKRARPQPSLRCVLSGARLAIHVRSHATSGLRCVSSLERHSPNASASWSTSAGQFSFSWRSPSLRSFLSTTEAHTHTRMRQRYQSRELGTRATTHRARSFKGHERANVHST